MTRETKVGLVVTSSFLFLVGVVVANKWKDLGGTKPDASAPPAEEASGQVAKTEPHKGVGTAPAPVPVVTPSSNFAPLPPPGIIPVVDLTQPPGPGAPLKPLPPLESTKTTPAATDPLAARPSLEDHRGPRSGIGAADFSSAPPVVNPTGTGSGHTRHTPGSTGDPSVHGPEQDSSRSSGLPGSGSMPPAPDHAGVSGATSADSSKTAALGTGVPLAPSPDWGPVPGPGSARSTTEPPLSTGGMPPGSAERKPEPTPAHADGHHQVGPTPPHSGTDLKFVQPDGPGSSTAGGGLAPALMPRADGSGLSTAGTGSGVTPVAAPSTPASTEPRDPFSLNWRPPRHIAPAHRRRLPRQVREQARLDCRPPVPCPTRTSLQE